MFENTSTFRPLKFSLFWHEASDVSARNRITKELGNMLNEHVSGTMFEGRLETISRIGKVYLDKYFIIALVKVNRDDNSFDVFWPNADYSQFHDLKINKSEIVEALWAKVGKWRL